MAERRMFAKSIVLSDVFLDMPMSARCLYFTLGMFADDDGFVGSPRSIMRQCGASMDDLNILLAKRYVLGFESGVIVIKHWKINNYLQNDRHKDTTYLEERDTLALDRKGAYTEKVKTQPETPCIQNGYSLDTQDRLGKVSIGKVSNYISPLPPLPNESGDFEEVKETAAYNGITAHDVSSEYQTRFNNIPGVIKFDRMTVKREMAISTILSHYSQSEIDKVFDKVAKSDFLTGINNINFKVTFDWLFNMDNFAKVLEGNYDNRKESPKKAEKTEEKQDRSEWTDEDEEMKRRQEEFVAKWRAKHESDKQS